MLVGNRLERNASVPPFTRRPLPPTYLFNDVVAYSSLVEFV